MTPPDTVNGLVSLYLERIDAAARSGEAQTFTVADLRASADHVDAVVAPV